MTNDSKQTVHQGMLKNTTYVATHYVDFKYMDWRLNGCQMKSKLYVQSQIYISKNLACPLLWSLDSWV